tara:strand:- start:28 stop:813 length:786 start_codon:yes stop_codon:yes gene_type:complete
VETDFSGEQSYSQAQTGDPSIGDTSISISSDDIAKGTTNNFGTGFADDAQATVDPSNVLSQASFNQARGITATNPYPDSFFSQLFGPENVNYAVLGIDTQGIANLAYDRYLNPLTSEGTLREGLSEGERTVLGNVVSIDRPQTTGETIARTAFGLASPLGPLMSFMGKDQLAIAPNLQGSKGVNYDPKLDPNSPEYQGPQGFLGQFGKGIESITFGGARPITEGTKGIMSLLEAQEAEKEMKDSVDQTGKNVKLGPESFLK